MIWVSIAAAHEISPTIADVVLDENGVVVTLSANAEALIAGIGPEHEDTDDAPEAARYNALRAAPAGELTQRIEAFAPRLTGGLELTLDGAPVALALTDIAVPPVGDTDLSRTSLLTLEGAGSSVVSLDWRFDEAFGASVLRLSRAGEDALFHSVYVPSGETARVPLSADAAPQSGWDVFRNYVVVGFEHIIPKGLDHILFVIGLFLLSTRAGPLIWQITAFTAAHTVTLALATLGLVSVSPAIVEPLIAASIAFIAVENIMTDRLTPWRPVTVFLFGLLHGLGFAGVLGEIGLPPGHYVTGLVAFNIGVEVGQLAVIAACFALVGFWFSRKPWYRRAIVIPASAAIALVAGFWVLERVGLVA